jgi:hypothetical protein
MSLVKSQDSLSQEEVQSLLKTLERKFPFAFEEFNKKSRANLSADRSLKNFLPLFDMFRRACRTPDKKGFVIPFLNSPYSNMGSTYTPMFEMFPCPHGNVPAMVVKNIIKELSSLTCQKLTLCFAFYAHQGLSF